MEWTRSTTASLARLSCTACLGSGVKQENDGEIVPCSCVLRAVFRACYARFRTCIQKEKYLSRVSFEHFGGKERRMMWGRKNEEYAADFHLVSRRALDPFHYRVFSYHFLLGGDWKLCCPRLGINRAQFFYAVYRVEEILGHVFYELEPYGLFPPRDYFATRLVRQLQPRPDVSSTGLGETTAAIRKAGTGRRGRRPPRSDEEAPHGKPGMLPKGESAAALAVRCW